jgi:hypothetical protein
MRPLRCIVRGLTMGGAMSAVEDPGAELTPAEARDLRRLAAFMVPASAEYGVPGADDAAIFADIVRSLGRDRDAVREALAMLCEIAGGDFAGLAEAKAEAAGMTLLGRQDPVVTALGRAVLQCYYPRRSRDARPRCRAAAALSEGPRVGTGRLVLAGDGAQPAENVARH